MKSDSLIQKNNATDVSIIASKNKKLVDRVTRIVNTLPFRQAKLILELSLHRLEDISTVKVPLKPDKT